MLQYYLLHLVLRSPASGSQRAKVVDLQVAQRCPPPPISGLAQHVQLVLSCLHLPCCPGAKNLRSSHLHVYLHLGSLVARTASVSLLQIREEERPGSTFHQIWGPGRCTASLQVQAWQVAQKPGHHLRPRVPRPHGRWVQPWASLSWLRAQQRSAGSELPPFVLEVDMEKTPKAQSSSQFHHKYPDRVSGAELIVQALAAALPETALPAVGGRRLGQEAPRCTRGLCRPALRPGCRHVEGGLLGLSRCCPVHQPLARLGR